MWLIKVIKFKENLYFHIIYIQLYKYVNRKLYKYITSCCGLKGFRDFVILKEMKIANDILSL